MWRRQGRPWRQVLEKRRGEIFREDGLVGKEFESLSIEWSVFHALRLEDLLVDPLTSGLGVDSVWMKMDRRLPAEGSLIFGIPSGWLLGRNVGLRRLSDGVMAETVRI